MQHTLKYKINSLCPFIDCKMDQKKVKYPSKYKSLILIIELIYLNIAQILIAAKAKKEF